jgi:hypothetical protein
MKLSSIIKSPRRAVKSLIARELSSIAPLFDYLIELLPQDHSDQQILNEATCKRKSTVTDLSCLNEVIEPNSSTLILLDGLFNYHPDIQTLLEEIKPSLNRESSIFLVSYSPYYRWLYQLTNFLGLREGQLPTTFLTKTDLNNFAKLGGYSVTRRRGGVFIPYALFGFGNLINGFLSLIPLIKELSLVQTNILRPQFQTVDDLTLSIVIPARNEKGNIENAVKGLSLWDENMLEIIFVEGHSTDETLEEILRVQKLYQNKYKIKVYEQSGKGKNDAVRLGFQEATGDLLTILDADLTVPPKYLHRFYGAYCDGVADFVNGSRLFYPMEDEAMRFLNRLGNVFFAKALSFVLDTHIGDSLCGTKLFSRKDYQRYKQWREEFGDFDPFGDFELLFPAALLGSVIVDVPVPYRARRYGKSNIDRFRHGFMLLKLTSVGLVNLKMNLFSRGRS